MNTFTEFLKNPFPLKTAVGYKNMVWGISLMLMAASYSIDNKILRLVIAIIAVLMSILSFATLFHKKENEDEMYTRHIGKASDLTVSLIILTLMLFAFLSSFLQRHFSVDQILFFSAGLAGFLQGLLFNIFEKTGN
jgi:hypothetical protein